jgi:hypothetical protein
VSSSSHQSVGNSSPDSGRVIHDASETSDRSVNVSTLKNSAFFCLEIQYWMLLAAVIVAAAITTGMRK